MALPRLNDVPEYELTVPSTKQQIKYRPFLVKEQKVLLIAYESKDIKHILNAVINCINSCTQGIDAEKLATFDTDYIFTQIRSKSAGENVEIGVKCTSCEHENPIKVNLEEVKIDIEDKDMHVKLNDTYTLKMKYPTYKDIINDKVMLNNDRSQTDQLLATLRTCMEAIQTENENILIKDESVEEVEEFINSLNDAQYGALADFVGKMPKMTYTKKFNCSECEKENKFEMEGLQDFFT